MCLLDSRKNNSCSSYYLSHWFLDKALLCLLMRIYADWFTNPKPIWNGVEPQQYVFKLDTFWYFFLNISPARGLLLNGAHSFTFPTRSSCARFRKKFNIIISVSIAQGKSQRIYVWNNKISWRFAEEIPKDISIECERVAKLCVFIMKRVIVQHSIFTTAYIWKRVSITSKIILTKQKLELFDMLI